MRSKAPRRTRAGVVVAAFVAAPLLALLGTSAPAAAHADLVSTDPAEGAVLDVVPPDVTLTFNESPLPESVVVSVEDETGFVVRVLDLQVDGASVVATWPPGMRGTQYAVNYRVVSDDGHPIEGTLRFSVTTAPNDGAVPAASSSGQASAPATTSLGASDPASTAAEDQGSSSLVVPVLAGLAVGVIIGLIVFALTRRATRRSAPASDERS